ncbi:MAG: His-Xaa-Ser system radical SAM maturase HxsB [Actinobacteria bacterium]|nr:His-Xaa-Ser system radical SAM maturase HxsB [Actinomycetota bacterium]
MSTKNQTFGSDLCWLPFRFERLSDDEFFISNIAGEWLFLNASEFSQLQSLSFRDLDLPRKLRAKHILTDSASSVDQRLLALKAATRMRRMTDLTGLHIFVVTLRCDHACEYCQVSRKNTSSTEFDMSSADAMRALDIVFDSPSRNIKIEFQGGESLLNFPLIREIVVEAERRNSASGKDLRFVVATNLVPLTEDILDFAEAHSITFSTSLDGPQELHNANRARPGRNSHELASQGIRRVRERLGPDSVSALMTTTLRSLSQPEDIVDEYVKHGLGEIFLRFLSPYGFAIRNGVRKKYGNQDWLDFYERGLRYIIKLNKSGTEVTEVLASIYLRKLLTNDSGGYVDLATPTGAGLGALVYNYDGDVYASDEGRMLREMGDLTFKLGSVREHSYRNLILSDALLDAVEASFAPSNPMCRDCAFEPFCGSDPVIHHTTQGDMTGFKPLSEFCDRTMSLVPLLLRLYREDRYNRDLFLRWATR